MVGQEAGASPEMEQDLSVRKLKPRDVVRLDPTKIHDLSLQVGVSDAENIVCRAMEDMAERLVLIGEPAKGTSVDELRKSVRRLIPVADQIGLTTLTSVAQDVTNCAAAGDNVALAATHARLMRVGDQSMSLLWDAQDLSV